MRRHVSIAVCVAGCCLSVPSPSVAQRQIYLAINGDDANPCTGAAPCRSMRRAEDLAEPGDIVEVGAGTYNGAIKLTKSGTADRRITYRGHQGVCRSSVNSDLHAPRTRPNPVAITDGWIVEASHIVIDCFRIRPKAVGNGVSITGAGTGSSAPIHRSYIDVVNNYVEYAGVDCGTGISLVSSSAQAYASTQIYVANNFVTGCAYGISVRATNSTIQDNELYRLRAWDGAGDMDYMRLFGRDLTIRGNYLHGNRVSDCNGEGCHIDCFQTFNLNGADWAYLQDVTIDRNTCFNAHQGILMQDVSRGNPGPPSGSHSNITVTNNVIGFGPLDASAMTWCMLFNSVTNVATFHNTCLSGQVRYRAGTTAVHRNNLHSVETKSPAGDDGTGSVTITNNLFYNPSHAYSAGDWPGNIVNINPLFVDAANHDYRLSAASPAIKAGAMLGVVLVDRNAQPRPILAPDIGAYQWSSVLPKLPH